MITPKMKPCPFCGGEAIRIVRPSPGLMAVWCQGCGAQGPMKQREEEAVAAWNRRGGINDGTQREQFGILHEQSG